MGIANIIQVPLGVILKNENKGDEMVDILLHLQQYTPAVECKKEVVVGTGEPFELTDAVLQKVCLITPLINSNYPSLC